MTMANEIGKRFKAVREAAKVSQVSFAATLGVSSGHISKIEAGKASPSTQLKKAICSQFGISKDWLLYGIGPMTSGENQLSREENRKLFQMKLETYIPLLFAINNLVTVYTVSLSRDFNLNRPDDFPVDNSRYKVFIDQREQLEENIIKLLELVKSFK